MHHFPTPQEVASSIVFQYYSTAVIAMMSHGKYNQKVILPHEKKVKSLGKLVINS